MAHEAKTRLLITTSAISEDEVKKTGEAEKLIWKLLCKITYVSALKAVRGERNPHILYSYGQTSHLREAFRPSANIFFIATFGEPAGVWGLVYES